MKVIIIAISFLSFCSNLVGSNPEINEGAKIKDLNSKESTTLKMKKTELTDLEELAWKNRIILVKEDKDSALQQLKKNKKEIEERHIIWFRLYDGEIKTNYPGKLEDKFIQFLEETYFDKFGKPAFLIGKDGGIKSTDKTFDLQNYFKQIDVMPMRIEEMK